MRAPADSRYHWHIGRYSSREIRGVAHRAIRQTCPLSRVRKRGSCHIFRHRATKTPRRILRRAEPNPQRALGWARALSVWQPKHVSTLEQPAIDIRHPTTARWDPSRNEWLAPLRQRWPSTSRADRQSVVSTLCTHQCGALGWVNCCNRLRCGAQACNHNGAVSVLLLCCAGARCTGPGPTQSSGWAGRRT